MPVFIKLSTSLRKYVPGYDPRVGLELDRTPGTTVSSMLSSLGVPLDQVKVVMINGIHGTLNDTPADGDRLGVFPAVGGG